MTITRTRRAAAVLLSAALGLAMAVSPGQQATAAPPTDGLALHYPLQTDTGTVVTDASGNDRHGGRFFICALPLGVGSPLPPYCIMPTLRRLSAPFLFN